MERFLTSEEMDVLQLKSGESIVEAVEILKNLRGQDRAAGLFLRDHRGRAEVAIVGFKSDETEYEDGPILDDYTNEEIGAAVWGLGRLSLLYQEVVFDPRMEGWSVPVISFAISSAGKISLLFDPPPEQAFQDKMNELYPHWGVFREEIPEGAVSGFSARNQTRLNPLLGLSVTSLMDPQLRQMIKNTTERWMKITGKDGRIKRKRQFMLPMQTFAAPLFNFPGLKRDYVKALIRILGIYQDLIPHNASTKK